jgi:hypothetical protein
MIPVFAAAIGIVYNNRKLEELVLTRKVTVCVLMFMYVYMLGAMKVGRNGTLCLSP